MKSYCRRIVVLLATIVCATSLWAQKKESHTMSATLYFRHDKYVLDESYLSNRQTIQSLDNFFEANGKYIDSISIVAYASPEGPLRYNQKLSARRAGTTKYWLLKRYKSLGLEQMREEPLGEDFTGLIERVEADKDVPFKREVLQILRRKGVHPDKKMRQLMKLRKGQAYSYIDRHHLPYLRTATTLVIYWSQHVAALPTTAPRKDVTSEITLPSHLQFRPLPDLRPARKTILALKTNALYDVATVVNFAVEVPLGDRFSLVYNHICPWWLTENNRYCLQLLSIGGEARWWFAPKPVPRSDTFPGRDRLVGHFLGAYAMSGKFDFQANTWACYQGEFWSAGLTYGYSAPLGKRMNIEFSLSVGYANIPYRHYVPTDDWQDLIRDKFNAGRLHWVGPTKAEISLVVPLTIKTKGGQR